MLLRAAVILAGCGHLDGTEIREAVITLLELDKHGVQVKCFSHNKQQYQVINHQNATEHLQESRNILVESSRISRGNIQNLDQLNVNDFEMLIIPGGYGAVQNFSNIFKNNSKAEVVSDLKKIIIDFYNNKKLIGAICIAPALVVASLNKIVKIEVTIGEDTERLIEKLGGIHISCSTNSSIVDKKNNIFSCSAYMRNDRFYNVYLGIADMINTMVNSC